MITITILKNPFNHSEKEVHACEYIPGKMAYEYVQPYILGLEDYIVSINGNVVEDVKVQLVSSDDWLAICPVVGKSGRDWFRTIFKMTLSYYTGQWFPSGNLWSYMASGAVNMIGGNLINHWFPPVKVDRSPDVNPSYNWGNAQSQTGQGNALAVTYGTMRTAGQVLAQHVSSDDEDQYLNILLCGGEGLIDSISDIRINDNPISYYKKVIVETRLGANDQTVISNFNDTYDDQSLAYELNTDSTWATQQTEGNAVEGLEITLQLPGGLYYANDNGSLGNASVTVQVQYRKVGATNWNDFTTATITAAKNTAFFRTYRLDNLTAAQYEVRAQCTAKSGTSTRYATHVYWTQLSSIMYDDFARPGKVLIGIKALATSQLSGGVPIITWLQTREKVWVWNAETRKYEQKSATNPAWAAYDMIHRCRQIKNIHSGNYEFVVQGAPAARAVHQDFVRWAEFCDDRKLTFHYIFDTSNDLWTLLQKPEGAGRGKVIMRGTKFGSVCDAPGNPVQLFTVGNILTDKFKETFVSLKDRANAIEVSFSNKEKAYEKEVITVYADDYDQSTEPNITQIILDGVTTVEQAYREAKYRLRLNQYMVRTVEHSADIDAIACQINDVVLLAHDVPQWGISGRLLTAAVTTLQLDREVTLEPYKSYAVAIKITNLAATKSQDVQSIVTVGVQGVTKETTTDTVTLTSGLSTIPLKWDLYSFGETNKVVKPFRVLNISRDQDLKRKITCLEYIEAVYNEATDIPEINYSELDTLLEVSSVSVAEETYRQKDGTMVSDINIAWNIPRTTTAIRGYKVLYSADNGTTWTQWCSGITALSTAIVGVKTGTTYLVRVSTINDLGLVSTGVKGSLYITGKDLPPSNVASISASIDTTDSTKINLSWPAVDDIDLKGYKLMEGNTVLTPTPIVDTRYTYMATSSRQHNFSVVAIDNSGNPSNIPATQAISVIIEPAQVAGFSIVPLQSDRSRLRMAWTANSESDISYYEIRLGSTWNTASVIATQLKATLYECTLLAAGSVTYMIKAVNVAGKYSAIATAVTKQYTLTPNAPANGKYLQTETDKSEVTVFWDKITDIDLDNYETAIGASWASATNIKTTKELFVKYNFTASTTYNVMVRAKNIAGYYSSILNIPFTVKVEPGDVINFTVSQSSTNRSILNFKWDAINEKGKIDYEIRQGVNWSNSTLIQDNIQTTNFDFTTTSTGTQNFFIKAKNTAGFYSQGNPIATLNIVLIPSAPAAGAIQQDVTNKAILNLSWTLAADTDYLITEIRIGTDWTTAPTLPSTRENKTFYTVAASGTYTFLVRTKNVAGYYSAIMPMSATVVLNPNDVTGFNLVQNSLDKRILNFTWNAVKDTDFAYIEIRKGSNWDAAIVVKSNITNYFLDYTTATEGTETYLIKAVNKSGNYSVNAGLVTKTITLKPSAITNLKAIVNIQNKSKLDISWNSSTDTDFNSYEVTINSIVTTTKDNSYQYTVLASGTYTIAVRVKNVGGYYSTSTSIIYAAQVEPTDVSGFTVTQSLQECSKLTLYWDKQRELDFAYVEIRQGVNWDNSTLVETRITGTSYTVTIFDEAEKTYWIKSVNNAGFYSQNAVCTPTVAFNLNPTAPTNLTVTQDVNDRSNIIVNWEGNGEYDFSENELRIGDTWETAIIRKNTKENNITFTPSISGNYKFILKSINKAGFFSDEVFTHFYVTLEPPTITNFQAAQNGEDVELQWNISSDADVIGFRIMEGSSYENGRIIAEGVTQTNFEVSVDTERTYYFHIKALNKSGHYSQLETTAVVTVSNLLPKNVILTYDEITLKSGTATNTEFGTSLINASNFGGKASDYPNVKASEVGGQVVLKLKKTSGLYATNGEYLCARKDMGQILTANVSTLFYATNAFALGGNAKLQFRTSKDAVTWTSWTDFKTAFVTFRYLDFKVVFVTVNNTITPEVNTLQINIDVPDTSKTGTATIPVGGLTISYGNMFWTEPAVLAHAVGVGFHTEIQSKNNTSFTVKILNNSNIDVGGKISWQVIGY